MYRHTDTEEENGKERGYIGKRIRDRERAYLMVWEMEQTEEMEIRTSLFFPNQKMENHLSLHLEPGGDTTNYQ